MNYTEFKRKLQKMPLFESMDIIHLFKNKQHLANQLDRWQKKRLIIKLKRGYYMFNENDRKSNPSRLFIAGQLYWPSYVSLEYALSFHGLIPERVADVTSITTKKPTRFKNAIGTFIYQHIKPIAFRGYKSAVDEAGLTFFIAEPEKAIVDFLYLNLSKIPANDMDIFRESFRLQNMDKLKLRRITELAKFFANKKLGHVAKNLCAFIKQEANQ